jgi:phage tail protein X
VEYRTIQGDTWDMISFKVYGDEKLFLLIMNSNKEHLDKIIFDAGLTLVIPPAPEQTADDLPPWKGDW